MNLVAVRVTRAAAFSLIASILCGAAADELPSPDPRGDTVIKEGLFEPAETVIESIDVPEESGGAIIYVEIMTPARLDLDLLVFPSDPRSQNFTSPLCLSDGVGAIESCAVERPESGTLWAMVESAGGKVGSRYRLSYSLLPKERSRLFGAERIPSSGEWINVGPDDRSYRVAVSAGGLGLLRIEGSARTVHASSEAGELPVMSPDVNRRLVPIGRPLGDTMPIVFGRTREDTSVLVTIGAAMNGAARYGNDRLSVLSELSDEVYYLLPFDSVEISDQTLKATRTGTFGGGPLETSQSGKLSKGGRAVFRLEAVDEALTVSVDSKYDLDLAVIDKDGVVFDIVSDRLVLDWRRLAELGWQRSPGRRRRLPEWLSGAPEDEEEPELYLVVFAAPGENPPEGASFIVAVTERPASKF